MGLPNEQIVHQHTSEHELLFYPSLKKICENVGNRCSKKALESDTGVRAHIIDTQTREGAQDKTNYATLENLVYKIY